MRTRRGPSGRGTVHIPGYRILERLGAGASGTVYLAVHEQLERRVALKVLAAGLFDAGETRARFLREAKLQARFSHPNLLRLFDAGFAGDHPYLAMELATGGSLRQSLSGSGSLAPREVAQVGASIAGGLAHAHATGIVHRDLKPENVLLSADGVVKVA
ncbi:MAG: serine/threonine protein kinase, partial [Candidatus Wallbacteria bacterium]|nr:serine/threonine protein kinase [Candidatus Wallbacteria bacterium]